MLLEYVSSLTTTFTTHKVFLDVQATIVCTLLVVFSEELDGDELVSVLCQYHAYHACI
jgi:hypothetical protein